MTRGWATLGFALLSGLSSAQSGAVFNGISQFYSAISERLPPTNATYISPLSSNPFSISPFSPALSKNPGAAKLPDDDPRLLHIISGHPSTTHGLTVIRDDVVAFFRGYKMEAQYLEWNRASGVCILRGDAKLTGDGAVVKAYQIVVDTQNRMYQAFESNDDLKPSLVGGLLLSDLYVKGENAHGTEHESFLENAQVTTCRYESPHFEIDAKHADVRFEKRIILRDVTIVLLQKPILKLPFLVLPLDNRSYQNLPMVGEDPVEGYFVKTHYGIPLQGNQSLYSRLDYMSRLGFGIGEDYFYTHDSAKSTYQGQFSSYSVPNAGSLQIQQTQSGTAGKLTYTVQNSIDNHDYLTSPTNVTEANRATFSLANQLGTTGLTFSRSANSSVGFNSSQESIGFSSVEHWTKAFMTNLLLTYNDSSTTFTSSNTSSNVSRETLDVNFMAQDDLGKATAMLAYQRSIPIGSIQNFTSPTDQTPSVTIQTNATKLFGANFGNEVPFKTSLSIGQFGNPTSGDAITRDSFNISFDKQTNPADRARFDLNGLFTQDFYSDSTAQFVIGFGGSMSYRLGKDTSFNVHYNFLEPEGYTPLGIDQTGKQNLGTEDLSFRVERSLLLGLQTGYDALNPEQGLSAWQPLGIRAEYTPTKDIIFRNNDTYDPIYKGFTDFRYDFSYKRLSQYIGVGGDYDNTRHIWTETNLFVNALKFGRTKIDLRASYNGYTKQFDQRQIALSYDLHDAELVFQVISNAVGYNNGTQFTLFLRLKALPFDTNFGSGSRGQAIGTGTGIGY